MDESVVDQIIGAVAEVEDLDMVLQRYVSTDAIRNLVKHDSNSWRLQFETQTHVVEVIGDNTILVDGERRRTLS